LSDSVYSLYLISTGLRQSSGETFSGVRKSSGKVLEFFISKRVGTQPTMYRSGCVMQSAVCVCLPGLQLSDKTTFDLDIWYGGPA